MFLSGATMRILVLFLLFQSTHSATHVPPLTLAEMETIALENNREIEAAKERVALAKAGITRGTALVDPSFTYRAWWPPLLASWNVNQTQYMFIFSQTYLV